MKKIVICFLSFLLLLSLTSCALFGDPMEEENTFSVNEVLTDAEINDDNREYFTRVSITLNGDFKEENSIPFMDSYAAIYNSSKAKILVKNEPRKADIDVSLADYVETKHSGAGPYAYDPVTDEATGITSYRYNSELLGVKFSGVCYFFATEEDFWMVDMACRPEDIEDMIPYFDDWAASVTFEDVAIYDYILG